LEFGIGKDRPLSKRITGTGNIFFIKKANVPPGRHVSYAKYVCNIRPQKTETHCVRMTAGGDQLDYPGDASSPAVAMLDAKLHINSTIADAHRYQKLLSRHTNEALPIQLRPCQDDTPRSMGRLAPHIEADGFVYLEIPRGMYGLKEAGILTFEQLVAKLAPHGYEPAPFTPGPWRHTMKPTTFTLCVDDFGVKYFTKMDDLHLITALHKDYEITTGWAGSLYCGLTLDWHYDAGYVNISMSG
jgi:hypothetical protein